MQREQGAATPAQHGRERKGTSLPPPPCCCLSPPPPPSPAPAAPCDRAAHCALRALPRGASGARQRAKRRGRGSARPAGTGEARHPGAAAAGGEQRDRARCRLCPDCAGRGETAARGRRRDDKRAEAQHGEGRRTRPLPGAGRDVEARATAGLRGAMQAHGKAGRECDREGRRRRKKERRRKRGRRREERKKKKKSRFPFSLSHSHSPSLPHSASAAVRLSATARAHAPLPCSTPYPRPPTRQAARLTEEARQTRQKGKLGGATAEGKF